MKQLLLFFFGALLLSSCADNEPIFIPLCIDQEIPVFAQVACPGSGDLTIWSFDGQDVFCFNEGGCYADPRAFIYDADCDLLCVLGGVDGNDTCLELSWADNAQYLELVYVY